MPKESLYIPFEILPEGKAWRVGQVYRVRAVLKQTGTDETGATFELVDVTSLEPGEEHRRKYITTDGGILKL